MGRVDGWLATRSFHQHRFADIGVLVQRNRTGSAAVVGLPSPSLNEAELPGRVVKLMMTLRDSWLLLDEIVVIDSSSEDSTLERVSEAGGEVHSTTAFLAETGRHRGKSEDRVSNRIAFAIVLAALIVGSSLIILSDIPPHWRSIPIIGLIGFLVAGVMGFWLLLSIIRHGRM